MGDHLQCQALARDIARRLHFETASHDELRVIDRVLTVLEQRRDRVGPLDIRDKRNWHTELGEGLLNAVIFCAIETMRAEDETRAELREDARRELLGESIRYEHPGYNGVADLKLLPLLRCERREILHVCSGALPRGEGIRVDIRPAARPDILADGRALPIASGSIAAVMVDPPYCEEYALSLYGVEYPRPSHLLAEAARVVRPGGRIVLVHYITAAPAPGTRFVKALGMSTGFDMPMRAVSIYERDHAELALGGAA